MFENEAQQGTRPSRRQGWRRFAAFGPGLLVMLADTDAGNIIAAAQAGAQTRYALLPLIVALTAPLYLIQELAARIGLFSGLGFGAAVRRHYGRFWALVALAGLIASALATLVTEFSGIAGVGELFGASREITLPAVSLLLLAIVVTGAYRRVEQIALILALSEIAFLFVAWKARPDWSAVTHDMAWPFTSHPLGFLAAATVGAVFNPWMIFYQQAATARKNLSPADFAAVRLDTAAGAVLTQALTGAVLVAAAASLANANGLDSIGAIARALSAVLGPQTGAVLFGFGVVGASLAAAIVASLALSWGVSEILMPAADVSRPDHPGLFPSRRALGFYAAAIAGSASFVWVSGDLVWLNLVAQAINALLFPITAALLIAVAAKTLPASARLRGAALAAAIGLVAVVACIAVGGAMAAAGSGP
jgi:Mn2+/Fe2+ NRAMP family transporter